MTTWIENALSDWSRTDVKLNPGASNAEIEHVEKILSFQFPEDFKELYALVNGFQGLDWQEYLFSLRSLKVIEREYHESANKLFVGFCDFLPSSHIIGFKKNEPGIFKMYPSIHIGEKEPIAQSIEEVVYMINSNSGAIY